MHTIENTINKPFDIKFLIGEVKENILERP